MGHREDVPYVIVEKQSSAFGAFLWGALLGAGTALLLAPRSGQDTRDELRAGALRLRDRAEDAMRNVTDSVSDTIGGVRGEVEGRIEQARDAFEVGRRAASESRRQMEYRMQEARVGMQDSVQAVRRAARDDEALDAHEQEDDERSI